MPNSGVRGAGIGGIAVDLPPYRVDLERWCDWTGASWPKIAAIVGRSFRLPGPSQSVYTMAANAVLKLIRNYDVDPGSISLLALGTESSNDNSAGPVIVKGMLNEALGQLGLPPLSRHCEVPEVKHACLGGVYALKNAVRHCLLEDSKAIVVCSDLALYARGSSGEPTQGAGAVALLVERNPALASLDLRHTGCASDYRITDFRKPLLDGDRRPRSNLHYPVFNGRYSTYCYLDQVTNALNHFYGRRDVLPVEWLESLPAVFFHRPYLRMPQTAFALIRLCAEGASRGEQSNLLQRLCREASVSLAEVLHELRREPPARPLAAGAGEGRDPFPLSNELARVWRKSGEFREMVLKPLGWGNAKMMELGNIYSGALLAWIAAGFEEAASSSEEWAGREVLVVGYGSGDAAEAMALRVAGGWREAARRIRFSEALAPSFDLRRDQYEALHAGLPAENLPPPAGFRIRSIGKRTDVEFQDEGVEYYAFSPAPCVTSRPLTAKSTSTAS